MHTEIFHPNISICAPAGYTAYLSAVRVDAAYNNPVMNVFVYLLSTAHDRKAKKKPSSKHIDANSS